MTGKPKAKSRLQTRVESQHLENESTNLQKSLETKTKQVRLKTRTAKIHLPLQEYFKHIPTLLLSLPFYWLTYFLFKNIYPTQIKDFLLINTYLPLQIPFFLGNFFLLSFLTLKSRRGAFLSLLFSFMLFLKLQSVVLDLPTTLGILAVFFALDLTAGYFERS